MAEIGNELKNQSDMSNVVVDQFGVSIQFTRKIGPV